MTRPTTDGWLAALGALALGGVAWWSANNALVLVVAPLLAVIALGWGLGVRNVRGLHITRRWPGELVAGRPGRGTLVLTRPSGRSRSFQIEEAGLSQTWVATVGEEAVVHCTWRFPDRGVHRVGPLHITSTWPFGLFRHSCTLQIPDTVLVGVRPHPSALEPTAQSGDGRSGRRGRVGTGDLVGLRAYAPGDPVRRVHWPTTARVGTLMMAERAVDEHDALIVEVVARATGTSWERELSKAAGQIQRAARQGLRIGLSLPSLADRERVTLPARAGDGWRRHLLETLARMPRVTP
ncbi:MAG: DUF58 domain-containing protein [Myxococcota bacterium]